MFNLTSEIVSYLLTLPYITFSAGPIQVYHLWWYRSVSRYELNTPYLSLS